MIYSNSPVEEEETETIIWIKYSFIIAFTEKLVDLNASTVYRDTNVITF